jgi:hypothetical protein
MKICIGGLNIVHMTKIKKKERDREKSKEKKNKKIGKGEYEPS